MDGSKQLELFDLDLYDYEPVRDPDQKEMQIQPCVEFKQLELNFSHSKLTSLRKSTSE